MFNVFQLNTSRADLARYLFNFLGFSYFMEYLVSFFGLNTYNFHIVPIVLFASGTTHQKKKLKN